MKTSIYFPSPKETPAVFQAESVRATLFFGFCLFSWFSFFFSGRDGQLSQVADGGRRLPAPRGHQQQLLLRRTARASTAIRRGKFVAFNFTRRLFFVHLLLWFQGYSAPEILSTFYFINNNSICVSGRQDCFVLTVYVSILPISLFYCDGAVLE